MAVLPPNLRGVFAARWGFISDGMLARAESVSAANA